MICKQFLENEILSRCFSRLFSSIPDCRMGVFALEFTCFFPACDRCDRKKKQLLWVIREHMYAHVGSPNAQTKMHKRKAGNERRDAHMNPRCTRERQEMKEGQRREAGNERRDTHMIPRCTRERQERSIQCRHTSAHLTCRHNISEERRDFSALFRVFLSLWGK